MNKPYLNKRQIRFSVATNLTPSQRQLQKAVPDFEIPIEIKHLLEKYPIKALETPLPTRFINIRPAPKLLYFVGNLEILHSKIIWIVGPRKPSSEWKQIIQKIFEILKDYKITTISGLAPGIDNLTHTFSIKYQIPTIAVLGWGIWFFLKSKNRELINQILQNNWLIISEFKLFAQPAKYTFPQRNRIIAGLSDILFLPQASLKSGSLITAEFAHKFKKDIYCTPGSIFDKNFEGTNELIKNNKATILTKFEEIPNLWELKPIPNHLTLQNHTTSKLSEIQTKILDTLKTLGPLSTNQLATKLNLPVFKILPEITHLEMNNQVYTQSGQRKIKL